MHSRFQFGGWLKLVSFSSLFSLFNSCRSCLSRRFKLSMGAWRNRWQLNDSSWIIPVICGFNCCRDFMTAFYRFVFAQSWNKNDTPKAIRERKTRFSPMPSHFSSTRNASSWKTYFESLAKKGENFLSTRRNVHLFSRLHKTIKRQKRNIFQKIGIYLSNIIHRSIQ